MKWISSLWISMLCDLVRLTNAVCKCGNGKQAVIPSKIIIDAPSPFNDTDGSPSSFGNTCVEQLTDSYICMGNNDNPLFDCNSNNNKFYGWNSSSISTITIDFTSVFESMNVLITFLISSSSNTSVPLSVWYITSNDNNGSSNDDITSSVVQYSLPTNLPEGSYQHNFTLSPDMIFNKILIIILFNPTFEWVAISRMIFCAATIKDRNVTFSSIIPSTTSIAVIPSTKSIAVIPSTTSIAVTTGLGSSVSVAISPTTSSSVSAVHVSSTVPSHVLTISHATSINPVSTTVSTTVSATVSATATITTTITTTTITAGGLLSSSTDKSVSVGVIIGALISVGSLLLMIIVLLIVIISLYRKRKQSKIDNKAKGVTNKISCHHDENIQSI